MSFPRYPKYKASGVEWLGEVPEHWKLAPVWLLFELGRGRVISHEEIIDNVGEYPVYSSQTENDGVMGSLNSYDFDGDYITWTTDGANAGTVFLRSGRFNCTNVCGTLKARSSDVLLDYCWRALAVSTAAFVRHDINPKLMNNVMGRIRISIPPLSEQTQIAAFLDRETAKIDGLVAEQQRLIELLKEKRTAVISHAVTKGLNPDAPLKPSGIEWLGDVPEHWEVRRLSPLSTKITNGYVGPTRDILLDEGVRYLQSLHIKGNEIRFDVPYFVSENWSNQHGKSILATGDVLIVQTGDIGQVTVVTDEFAGCNCHALIIVAPVASVVDGKWISWVLNSDYGLHSLLSIQTGALHPHLNCGDVKDISIPLPPIAEQRNIVTYIVEQVRGFDALAAEAQHAIDLLQERRTALISAATTGQIDVRPLNERKPV